MMKRLKRLFFTTLLLMCFLQLPFGATIVSAEEESSSLYAVVDSDSIWFYAEPDENSGLFILPRTYYVLILTQGETFCAVRYLDDVSPYKSIIGYCKTADLTPVDFVPSRPYLKLELTVTYTLSASSAMGNGSFDSVQKSFIYYGESYLGTSRFYYVYADGVFDYLPAVQEISYDLNTDYLAASASEPTDNQEEEPSASSPSAVQIVSLCLSAAVLLAIAVFVLRGKKAPSPQEEF